MEEGKLGRRHTSASCQDNELEEAREAEGDSWKRACSPTQWSALGEMWMSCLPRAVCCSLQASVQLQFDFLTDAQFNEPVYRRPADAAIPPVSKVQQDSRSLLRIALSNTTED